MKNLNHCNFSLRAITISAILLSSVFNQAWSNPPSISVEKMTPLDGIAAIVNDDIILDSELKTRIQEAKQELAARNILIQDAHELELKVLDSMILEKLQISRAEQLGLNVSDEEVFNRLQDIAEQNHLTMAELRDRLNEQAPEGFSTIREKIRQQILIQKLREVEVIAKTQVTEGEIDNYLQRIRLQSNNNEYHLQHMMVSLPENATPEQRQAVEAKAQDLLNKLHQGEDFTQLAVRYSNGNKALEGGDLGWLSADQVPTFFVDTVEQLKQGQVSDLIRSPLGYHILKLLGVRDKSSQIVNQYQVFKFTILSDDAMQTKTPPKDLQDIAASLHSIADFKALHARYADIPASVNQNSELGWQTLADLPTELSQHLETINHFPGAAQPYATSEGWVILYVNATRQTDISLKTKRQKAMQTLQLQKANESYEIWLRRLKEEAIIDNRLLNPVSESTQDNIEGSL